MSLKSIDTTDNKICLIGLRGAAGAGKDTMADYLQTYHGFTKLSCATPLKLIIAQLTGWDYNFVNGTDPATRPLRETLVHPFYKKTCRELMQFVGTDLFRNQLHSDIWIYCLQKSITECSNKRIIITDLRFENEVQLIQNLNGRIVKIIKPDSKSTMQGNTAHHVSEKEFKVDNETVILNDGSKNDFYVKIEEFYQIIINDYV